MRTYKIPPTKLVLLSAAFCALTLAFSHNANANTILGFFPGDTHVVGTVTPGAPGNPASVKDYINFMITLSLGASVPHDFGGAEGMQKITRTTNTFANLPTASATGAVTGTGITIDLNLYGTFTYLFAKYDGQRDISEVWYIGGLTGQITIPLLGPKGHALSGWILFGPTGGSVPDGGATVMLLGAALGALGVVRRYLFS
jgi:hypothetical protein